MVRDNASQAILRDLGAEVVVGGCSTLFLPPNPEDWNPEGDVIISVRHPLRMSVPPKLQWQLADDLRRLVAALRAEYLRPVYLACHDYIDLEYAAGFPDAAPVYFDDVGRYMAALKNCALHVSYRLHGFCPVLLSAPPSVHLSYDERGRSMLRTDKMESWDIGLMQEKDCIGRCDGAIQHPMAFLSFTYVHEFFAEQTIADNTYFALHGRLFQEISAATYFWLSTLPYIARDTFS
jgi:hypothetical protein